VGGRFVTAGSTTAVSIAKWNGSSWSALGTGLNSFVYATAVSGSDLYVGGNFSAADGSPASFIAKWNGSSWSALGGGAWNVVYALAVNASAGKMMVGGTFQNVGGGTIANYIASFTDSEDPLPVEITSFIVVQNRLDADLKWTTATEANNYGFEIERRTLTTSVNNQSSTWKKITFISGLGSTNSPHEYTFTDRNLSAGNYAYRIKQIDNSGAFTYTKEAEVEIGLVPREFTLSENYPNPFNPSTTIQFSLPQAGFITLKIYNTLGEEIASLISEKLDAGTYTKNWNATDISSGVYFYRLHAGSFVETKKLVLLK